MAPLRANFLTIEFTGQLHNRADLQAALHLDARDGARPSIARYLHRRAISRVVPERVVWKSTKDMGHDRVVAAMQTTGIIQVATRARELEATMPAALEAIIDRDKWRQQIDRASQGQASQEFAFQFRRNTDAIGWLSQWVHDGAPTRA